MQLPHKIVTLQHSPHVQCQRQGHSHRKSFGNGHHDERDRHHEIAQHHLGHSEVVFGLPQRVGQDVVTQKQDEGCYRHAHAYFTNQRGQPVELLVQGSLHTRGLCRCACHLSYLRTVAHCCHYSPAVSVHHQRRAQHHIFGIGFARLGMGSRRTARVWPVGIHHLGGQHLTRQR